MHKPTTLSELMDNTPDGDLKESLKAYTLNERGIPETYKGIVNEEFDEYVKT
jgi:hypothetical protein